MIVLSQSMIKEMFYKLAPREYCPRSFFEKYILKKDCRVTTDPQRKGNYFESLLLGGDVPQIKGKGRSGEIPIDYARLQEQAKLGKQELINRLMFVHTGYNTQVRLRKHWKAENIPEDVYIEGVLDLFPTLFLIDGELRVAIIDVKTTKDLNSTWGNFAWGNFEEMDWLQGIFYHALVRDIDWQLNSNLSKVTINLIKNFEWTIQQDEIHFFFWVFNIKDPLENKFLEVKYDYDKHKYLTNSIHMAVHEMLYQQSRGYPERPGNHCLECLLDCTNRKLIKTV